MMISTTTIEMALSQVEKLQAELVKLGWIIDRDGPPGMPEWLFEIRKGSIIGYLSDVCISWRHEDESRGVNMWPLVRIREEKVFMIPDGETDEVLSNEEKELRDSVLKFIV